MLASSKKINAQSRFRTAPYLLTLHGGVIKKKKKWKANILTKSFDKKKLFFHLTSVEYKKPSC